MKLWGSLLFGLILAMPVHAEIQRDWFDLHLKNLQEKFDQIDQHKYSQKPEDVAIVEQNLKAARTDSFYLEILLEVFENKYGELKGFRKKLKFLEDKLGVHVDIMEHIKVLGQALNEVKLTSDETDLVKKALVKYRARSVQSRKDLVGSLEHERWLTSPVLLAEKEVGQLVKHPGETAKEKLERKLDKIKWDKFKDERKYILKWELAFIKNKLETPQDIISGSEEVVYDLHELNGKKGLHDRRRTDRKFVMLFPAMPGLFVLSDEPMPESLQELLKDPTMLKSPYSKLPEPLKDILHIFIRRGLFFEQNRVISEFGRAKDFGEALEEWLPEILYDEGNTKKSDGSALTREEAEALSHKIVTQMKGYEPPIEIAHKAYQRYLGERENTGNFPNTVLAAYRKTLKSQLKMSRKEDCARMAKALGESE